MPIIEARTTLSGGERDCDKMFSDIRNKFRGLFDICGNIACHREGKVFEGKTEYVFHVDCQHKDAPVVRAIFISLGFIAKYTSLPAPPQACT